MVLPAHDLGAAGELPPGRRALYSCELVSSRAASAAVCPCFNLSTRSPLPALRALADCFMIHAPLIWCLLPGPGSHMTATHGLTTRATSATTIPPTSGRSCCSSRHPRPGGPSLSSTERTIGRSQTGARARTRQSCLRHGAARQTSGWYRLSAAAMRAVRGTTTTSTRSTSALNSMRLRANAKIDMMDSFFSMNPYRPRNAGAHRAPPSPTPSNESALAF